ncbi:hypothetical protein HMPREF7215_1114 [Pyramidobacter piscolens W5455]|uniref:Uncharacterized protein n=1 Tax=Pyramidobacter piscolens W5455 TaxID=352165 RepID=A0ABM9ZSX7_9BACT|nr:hypothetical protein HMPREF7215_1114 [Pyramidobacter piscolens W5455]
MRDFFVRSYRSKEITCEKVIVFAVIRYIKTEKLVIFY